MTNSKFGTETSDIDRHIYPDPSSSISDPSQIGQTGTTHTLLHLAVYEWSNRWRELMYSRSGHETAKPVFTAMTQITALAVFFR